MEKSEAESLGFINAASSRLVGSLKYHSEKDGIIFYEDACSFRCSVCG